MSYIIKHTLGTAITFLFLFVAAGTINYFPGLIYLFISLLALILHYTVLTPDKGLLEERSNPKSNTKEWDKKVLGLLGILTIVIYITAGLDTGRYHTSPVLPLYFMYIGVLMTFAGQIIFMLAQKQNKFFSSVVRIQTDRGHAVHQHGLYSIVRHPAYLGMIIQSIGFIFLFRSLWTIIPVALSIFLIIYRTYREDLVLQNELPDYKTYQNNTKYRLVPFVW